jgi:hypothetical protein
MLLGLKLVLADPDPFTYNISAGNIKKALTPNTRVIVPVHLFGQCADMESIMELHVILTSLLLKIQLRQQVQTIFLMTVLQKRPGQLVL